jgi:Protein of unknown function, DUF488
MPDARQRHGQSEEHHQQDFRRGVESRRPIGGGGQTKYSGASAKNARLETTITRAEKHEGHFGGATTIKLKRAYEKPARDDGERILVERLWPRSLAKVQAKVDLWLKDVAPSTELRKWSATSNPT